MLFDAFGYGGYGPYQILDGGNQPTIFGGQGGVLNTVLNEQLPPITDGGGVQRPAWWQVLIPTAGMVLRDVYGSRAAVADYSNRAQQQYYIPPQAYSTVPQQGGVGFGVDSRGIRLSDGSYIGWGVVALGGGLLILVQMRPFSRK